MPGAPSKGDGPLVEVPEDDDEDDGECVGCKEVAEDMAKKGAGVLLLAVFVLWLLVNAPL